jgi:hypothetical protein
MGRCNMHQACFHLPLSKTLFSHPLKQCSLPQSFCLRDRFNLSSLSIAFHSFIIFLIGFTIPDLFRFDLLLCFHPPRAAILALSWDPFTLPSGNRVLDMPVLPVSPCPRLYEPVSTLRACLLSVQCINCTLPDIHHFSSHTYPSLVLINPPFP